MIWFRAIKEILNQGLGKAFACTLAYDEELCHLTWTWLLVAFSKTWLLDANHMGRLNPQALTVGFFMLS